MKKIKLFTALLICIFMGSCVAHRPVKLPEHATKFRNTVIVDTLYVKTIIKY